MDPITVCSNSRIVQNLYQYILYQNYAGKMFPSRGDLHVAPFTDEALYMEQINKVNFWYQEYFHGVNLGCLRDAAMKEYFRQPIVSNFCSCNIEFKTYHQRQKYSHIF